MLFQKLIKMEKTIEKSANFQQILLNIQTSCSQNFNVVASFVLELLGFLSIYIYIYILLLCSFSEINKNGRND